MEQEEEGALCSFLEPDDAAASSPRFGFSSSASQQNPVTPTYSQRTSNALAGSGNVDANAGKDLGRTWPDPGTRRPSQEVRVEKGSRKRASKRELAGSGNLQAQMSSSAARTSLALASSGPISPSDSNSAWRSDLEERLKAREACIAARDARIAELEQHSAILEVRMKKLQAEFQEKVEQAVRDSKRESNDHVVELQEKISELQERLAHCNSNMVSNEYVVDLENKVSGLQDRLEHRIRNAAVLEDRIGMLECDLEQRNERTSDLRAYLWAMHEMARRQLGQTLGARDLLAQQLGAADDLLLLKSALLNWACVTRDSRHDRHRQSMVDQDGEVLKRCKAAEQHVLKLKSERETLQHRLGDATVHGARLAATLRVQGTRLLDRAFAITGTELQRVLLDCWICAIPCLRLDRSLESTEKRCVDLYAGLQESQTQLQELHKQSDRIRMLEDENVHAREKIAQMQEERKKVVEGARKHVEDRVMVRMQSAIATVAAEWEKEKQELEARIAELSRGNHKGEAQQSNLQMQRQTHLSDDSSGPAPSPRNDPRLIPEAAEFFKKRALKENLADASESLLLASQSLKKGYPFEKMGKLDRRHIFQALAILGRVVDSSLLKDVVEASKRWHAETSHLSNASPRLKRHSTEVAPLKKLHKQSGKLPSVHSNSPVSRRTSANVQYMGSRAPRYWG